jgi:hypothetical protein
MRESATLRSGRTLRLTAPLMSGADLATFQRLLALDELESWSTANPPTEPVDERDDEADAYSLVDDGIRGPMHLWNRAPNQPDRVLGVANRGIDCPVGRAYGLRGELRDLDDCARITLRDDRMDVRSRHVAGNEIELRRCQQVSIRQVQSWDRFHRSIGSGERLNGRPSIGLLGVHSINVPFRADKCNADKLARARPAVFDKIRPRFDAPGVTRRLKDFAKRYIDGYLKLGPRLLVERCLGLHPVPRVCGLGPEVGRPEDGGAEEHRPHTNGLARRHV